MSTDNESLYSDETPIKATRWQASLVFSGSGFGAQECELTTGLTPLTVWERDSIAGVVPPHVPAIECTYGMGQTQEALEDAVVSVLRIGEAHIEGIRRFTSRHAVRVILSVTLSQFEGAVPLYLPRAILARITALNCDLDIGVPLAWCYPEEDCTSSMP